MGKIEWTQINNDYNGNPRYVCHFLHLCTAYENSQEMWDIYGIGTVSEKYRRAVKRANKIGGRKFHNKQYGGGIVFSTYNLNDLEKQIRQLVSQA